MKHLVASGRYSDAGAATPWLMDIMSARLVFFEEAPSDHARLNGALLNKLRGGGLITGRKLYQQNVTYKPTFTIVIGANSLMDATPFDEAVVKSMHAFRMPSTFVPQGDPRIDKVLVFKKDDGLLGLLYGH
eukprot:m.11659 g.11659  ORF g.11659 m.11659 type:complete len:131 (+) comp4466_c0_seq2:1599-1991(+)